MEYPSGLAGPGIVVGTGMFGAAFGLITSLIILSKCSAKRAMILAVTALIVSALILLLLWRAKQAREEKRKDAQFSLISYQKRGETISMGLGMAKPNFFEKNTIYFYQPQLKKSVNEHLPLDSLVFQRTELGYTLTYAPPWFYPEYIKLDYDILLIRCMSITTDWVQVIVNKQTGKTMWMSVHDLNVEFWPSFLLKCHSVKNISTNNQLRVKPLGNSAAVNLQGIYKPVEINSDWMRVEIYNDGYQLLGDAWLRWYENGELLINYELFS
ncbi:hypothetical protein [Fulvivirga lutea]|uniref:Uncharacterized protein n=1 Tax=Fulvivirga lutea TaxID=2810512 RepID=A0A974WHZ0_9BACT|nr:hypothetical protein [Fulvivirga lutea]QSE98746.1 hypothetical protein JR347_06605 [Fulvivirga lutea]